MDRKPTIEPDYILCPECDKIDNTGLWLNLGTDDQSGVIWCSCGCIIKYNRGALDIVGRF